MTRDTTRAAVLRAYDEPLRLEDLPLPAELEPGAALVRLECTTLCATDAHLWKGGMGPWVELPLVLGHEMMGRIEAIDPQGARDLLGRQISVGDRVVWSESTCGHCYGCAVLREPVLCVDRGYGFRQRADRPPYVIGGLAEYCYVSPGSARVLVPDDVKDTWAAAAGCAVKTVLRAFSRAGGVTANDTVVVQGAGPLGLVATAYAHASGAGRVITIGAPDDRLALAREWGASAVVSLAEFPEPDARIGRVMELTGGRGGDLVLDFAGAPTANREGVLMCAQRGRHVVVGLAGPNAEPIPADVVMGRELSVLGSVNGDAADLYNSLEFLRAFADRYDWDRLFAEPMTLTEATTAIEATASMAVVKAVVTPAK